MCIRDSVDSILHLLRNRRINEVGCTNPNGRSTAHQELNGILGRRNAAQTNNRNVYGMSPEFAENLVVTVGLNDGHVVLLLVEMCIRDSTFTLQIIVKREVACKFQLRILDS